MPINYLALLTSPRRTPRANLHLGMTLAFVAGALNAGGFLAIGQYTSHMSGIVSSAADNIVLGHFALAFSSFLALCAFLCGSASTAIFVNYARRNGFTYIYTPTLIFEAVLLLFFGLVGKKLQQHELIQLSLIAILLCYVMGLQNALITKISNAEIRTTHVTGMVTDIGIELGKLLYWNRSASQLDQAEVSANRNKLKIYGLLMISFFSGGLVGALGFKHLGFIATVPLAIALITLSIAPAFTEHE